MLTPQEPVWLFDVDNTLFDNDRFVADLSAHLETTFGAAQRDRYWALYAGVREETGYADYLATLQRFRPGLDGHPGLLHMSTFVLDYPFAAGLYEHALDVLAQRRLTALTVVLSDGDIVFQPRKIVRAGIWDAVEGRVLVDVHKELALDAMQTRYPSSHYMMVDDKPMLLAAIKRNMGARVTTIFVRQGHYAAEAATSVIDPPPDVTIDRIGDLVGFALPDERAADAGDRNARAPRPAVATKDTT